VRRNPRGCARAAAAGETEIAELWRTEEERRLVGARHWVVVLGSKGKLRRSLSVAAAVDRMWLPMAPDNYTRLVETRGWTRSQYQRWLVESIRAMWS
jgi:hypothetical protein